MDIALAIEKLVPSAKYRGSLTVNTQEAFNTIIWEDSRQKPAWDELKAVELDVFIDSIRPERNILLQESDKYMFSDYPITAVKKQEFVIYRQELRDLPQTITLENPNFPLEPSEN